MNEFEKQKLIEETKTLKIDRYSNLIKGIALLIGSIVLFIAIQRPESILNRRLSQETISRERAKLVFNLTQNNKDNDEILLGLSIIEKAYPEADIDWIHEIKKIYDTKEEKLRNEKSIQKLDSLYQKKIISKRQELRMLYDKKERYQFKLITELSGEGGSNKKGYGPEAKKYKDMVRRTEYRIREVQKEIKKLENELNERKNTATNNG